MPSPPLGTLYICTCVQNIALGPSRPPTVGGSSLHCCLSAEGAEVLRGTFHFLLLTRREGKVSGDKPAGEKGTRRKGTFYFSSALFLSVAHDLAPLPVGSRPL